VLVTQTRIQPPRSDKDEPKGRWGRAMDTVGRATVAVVAPFDYTHMIWAVVYGLVFWGYLPGWRVWVGAAIIVASGLFILLREQATRRRLARSADTFRDGFSS